MDSNDIEIKNTYLNRYRNRRSVIQNLNYIRNNFINEDLVEKKRRIKCRDILITTPGRIIEFLNQSIISLSQIKYLILNEAEYLLDIGFEPQLNSIIFDYDMTYMED